MKNARRRNNSCSVHDEAFAWGHVHGFTIHGPFQAQALIINSHVSVSIPFYEAESHGNPVVVHVILFLLPLFVFAFCNEYIAVVRIEYIFYVTSVAAVWQACPQTCTLPSCHRLLVPQESVYFDVIFFRDSMGLYLKLVSISAWWSKVRRGTL
jgi:hypothetical protein